MIFLVEPSLEYVLKGQGILGHHRIQVSTPLSFHSVFMVSNKMDLLINIDNLSEDLFIFAEIIELFSFVHIIPPYVIFRQSEFHSAII